LIVFVNGVIEVLKIIQVNSLLTSYITFEILFLVIFTDEAVKICSVVVPLAVMLYLSKSVIEVFIVSFKDMDAAPVSNIISVGTYLFLQKN
jgi:hypothetical protein